MTTRHCPNCDDPVTFGTHDTASCRPCGITWAEGTWRRDLPLSPIGEAEREASFRRAWARRRQ